jgi:hypothetical protein
MPATLKPGKRSSCRLLKIQCDQCGIILRGSAAALRAGLPVCACGGSFGLTSLADVERVDPDTFEQTVNSLGQRAHTEAMRELGYTDMIERRAPPRRIPQPQCAYPSCSRFRALGVQFCSEHQQHDTLPF